MAGEFALDGTFARIGFTLSFIEDGGPGEFPDELFGGDRSDADNAELDELEETAKRVVHDAFAQDEIVLGSVVFERSGPVGVVAIKTEHATLSLDKLLTALHKVKDDVEGPVRTCAEGILRRHSDHTLSVNVPSSHIELEPDAVTVPKAPDPAVERQIFEGLALAAVIVLAGIGCLIVAL